MWPQWQYITEGSSLSIQCLSTIVPKWIHNGDWLSSHKLDGTSVSIPHAKLSDAGEYICLGADSKGTFITSSAIVKVVSECSINKYIVFYILMCDYWEVIE